MPSQLISPLTIQHQSKQDTNQHNHSPPPSTSTAQDTKSPTHQQQQQSENLTGKTTIISPALSTTSSTQSSTPTTKSVQRSLFSSDAINAPSTSLATHDMHGRKLSIGCGLPRPAVLSLDNAPVHIDVGGIVYTSSLETLTNCTDSLISRMFNGTVPIVLDSLKQHYFIDRDGKLFRHVLNFMRTGYVSLPSAFDDHEGLLVEARFYELNEMVRQLEQILEGRASNNNNNSRKLVSSKSIRFSPYGNSSSNRVDGLVSSSSSISSTAVPSSMFNKKMSSTSSCEKPVEDAVEDMPSVDEDITAAIPVEAGSSLVIEEEVAATALGEATTPQPNSTAPAPPKVKILIVNQVDKKLFVSGESQTVRRILPELPEAELIGSYLTRLSLSEQPAAAAGLDELHLVKLMERIYEQGFALEACHSSPGGDQSHHSEESTQYIFVLKR
jgi:hypothetical protein